MNKLLIFIAVYLCFSQLCVAQSANFYQQDMQIWTNTGIKKQVKKYDFALEQGLRFGQNASQLSNSFTAFNVGYGILPQLNIGLGYRLSEIPAIRHRVDANLRVKFRFDVGKKKDLYLSNRLRYSKIFRAGKMPQTLIRNAVALEYKQKKLPIMPHIGYEWFFGQGVDEFGLNRDRAKIGFSTDFGKHISLDLDYIRQTQLNAVAPARLHIYSLELLYKL